MKRCRENASEKLHSVFNKSWLQVDEKCCKNFFPCCILAAFVGRQLRLCVGVVLFILTQ